MENILEHEEFVFESDRDIAKGCFLRVGPLFILIIIVAILSVLLSGCKSSKEFKEHKEYKERTERLIDSLTSVITEKDSVDKFHLENTAEYHNRYEGDTVIIKDSVFFMEYSDGTRVEQYFHEKSTIKVLFDTLYVNKNTEDKTFVSHEKTDSLSSVHEDVKSDSVSVADTKEKTIVKKRSFKSWACGVVSGIILLLFLFYAWKYREIIISYIKLL